MSDKIRPFSSAVPSDYFVENNKCRQKGITTNYFFSKLAGLLSVAPEVDPKIVKNRKFEISTYKDSIFSEKEPTLEDVALDWIDKIAFSRGKITEAKNEDEWKGAQDFSLQKNLECLHDILSLNMNGSCHLDTDKLSVVSEIFGGSCDPGPKDLYKIVSLLHFNLNASSNARPLNLSARQKASLLRLVENVLQEMAGITRSQMKEKLEVGFNKEFHTKSEIYREWKEIFKNCALTCATIVAGLVSLAAVGISVSSPFGFLMAAGIFAIVAGVPAFAEYKNKLHAYDTNGAYSNGRLYIDSVYLALNDVLLTLKTCLFSIYEKIQTENHSNLIGVFENFVDAIFSPFFREVSVHMEQIKIYEAFTRLNENFSENGILAEDMKFFIDQYDVNGDGIVMAEFQLDRILEKIKGSEELQKICSHDIAELKKSISNWKNLVASKGPSLGGVTSESSTVR